MVYRFGIKCTDLYFSVKSNVEFTNSYGGQTPDMPQQEGRYGEFMKDTTEQPPSTVYHLFAVKS